MTLFGQVSRALCRSPLFRPRSPLPRVSAPKVRPPRLGPHGPARGFRSPMRPYVVTAVLCVCLGTSVSASPAPRRRTAATDVLAAYEEQMSEIMEEMDANEDGMLDLNEFDGMMERLDISDAELDDLCKCTPSPPPSIYGQPSSPGQRGVDTYRV